MASKPLVYYVEDDDNLADLYGQALYQAYEVVRFRDPVQALQTLEGAERLPDLLLLDYALPQLSGLELLTRVRERAEWDSIMAIMVSNHDSPELTSQAFRLGALDWVLKSSMTPDQVAERLRRRTKYGQRQRGRPAENPSGRVRPNHTHDSHWPASADWLDLRNHLVKVHGEPEDEIDNFASYVDGTTGRRRNAEERHRAVHGYAAPPRDR